MRPPWPTIGSSGFAAPHSEAVLLASVLLHPHGPTRLQWARRLSAGFAADAFTVPILRAVFEGLCAGALQIAGAELETLAMFMGEQWPEFASGESGRPGWELITAFHYLASMGEEECSDVGVHAERVRRSAEARRARLAWAVVAPHDDEDEPT